MKLCEICGVRPAKYVCQRCGAAVCEHDFDLEHGLCSKCLMEVGGVREAKLLSLPFKMFILGIAATFIGFILMMVSLFLGYMGTPNISGGGIVMIGPIPFIFGFGGERKLILIILGVLIAVLIIIQVLALWYKSKQ